MKDESILFTALMVFVISILTSTANNRLLHSLAKNRLSLDVN